MRASATKRSLLLSWVEWIYIFIFQVLQYLMDFDATHCMTLPASEFRQPWNE